MLSKILLWQLLYMATGSRLGAFGLLLIIWVVADRFTFQVFPSPLRLWSRWRRAERLRHLLLTNPHDRQARRELAEILVSQRRFGAAVDLLKPNMDAGDDDTETLFLMGVACFGSGRSDQGEVFLAAAREQEPTFRLGAIDLELGRWRLARGDAKGARDSLEQFCQVQHGTVEGKVLLARALGASGDPPGAARLRAKAWEEYRAAPLYQRRRERLWAWRARPSRPVTYAIVVVVLIVGLWRMELPAPSAPPRDPQRWEQDGP